MDGWDESDGVIKVRIRNIHPSKQLPAWLRAGQQANLHYAKSGQLYLLRERREVTGGFVGLEILYVWIWCVDIWNI